MNHVVENYDVAVIGAGHAGCEAALAAARLGMETIIEGGETAEQVEVLKELRCDVVQGFFFGRPEPEEKFYELFM